MPQAEPWQHPAANCIRDFHHTAAIQSHGCFWMGVAILIQSNVEVLQVATRICGETNVEIDWVFRVPM